MCPGKRPSSPTRASELGRGLRAALLLAALLLSAAAGAEGARERANALFRQGSALFAKGKYERALELLEQARGLYPSHKIEVSIGYTLELLGRGPEAAQSFERFLADPASQGNPGLVSEVERKLRLLKRSLARLTLNGTVAGDAILVGGVEAGRAPLPHPLYLRPGEHRVTVQRGARTLFEQTLAIEAGEHRLALVSDAAPPPRVRTASRRTPLHKRWWLWAIGGAVISAAVVGAVAATSGGSERLPTGSLGTMDLRK